MAEGRRWAALAAVGRQALKECADLWMPPVCGACGHFLASECRSRFCPDCTESLTPSRTAHRLPGGPTIDAWGPFEGELRLLIQRLKFRGELPLARPLGELLADLAESVHGGAGWNAVLPVPLHATRWRSRGFNQALLLADVVGRRTGLPVRQVLVKNRGTPSQTALDGMARRHNLRGAFSVHPAQRAGLDGARVVVVDDVATTGATLAACATALRTAGAASVTALVLGQRGPSSDGL